MDPVFLYCPFLCRLGVGSLDNAHLADGHARDAKNPPSVYAFLNHDITGCLCGNGASRHCNATIGRRLWIASLVTHLIPSPSIASFANSIAASAVNLGAEVMIEELV